MENLWKTICDIKKREKERETEPHPIIYFNHVCYGENSLNDVPSIRNLPNIIATISQCSTVFSQQAAVLQQFLLAYFRWHLNLSQVSECSELKVSIFSM